jgi:hypothetical protein
MVSDKKLFWSLLILLFIPLTLAIFAVDRFRYPCQDPKNWDKEMCKKPQCEVTRTCPENIFKTKVAVENVAPAQQCITCQPPTAGVKNGK